MSRKVPILVPAPIRHIPARSRTARTSYAPMVEEVELRELSRADAPRGPDLPVNGDRTVLTRLIAGSAWRPIGCYDAFHQRGNMGGRPRPDACSFASWLRGGEATPNGMDATDMGRCLEGTPLLARLPGRKEPLRPEEHWNAAKQGILLLDGREMMSGVVRDYVDGNIALIDDVPFVRMVGPMCYLTAGNRAFEPAARSGVLKLSLLEHPGGWTTQSAVNFGNRYRFDRLQDISRATGLSGARLKPGWSKDGLDGIVGRDDDDLGLMLRESLRMIAAYEPREGYPFDKGRLEAFQAYVALGSVGAIASADLARAWEFVRGFAESVTEMDRLGWVKQEARRIQSYAELVALPRLSERTLSPDEDAGFLAALSRA